MAMPQCQERKRQVEHACNSQPNAPATALAGPLTQAVGHADGAHRRWVGGSAWSRAACSTACC